MADTEGSLLPVVTPKATGRTIGVREPFLLSTSSVGYANTDLNPNVAVTTAESDAGLTEANIDVRFEFGDISRYGATEAASDVSAAIATAVSVVDGTDFPLIMRGDYTITSGVTFKDHHVEATHATLNCDTVSGAAITIEKDSSLQIEARTIFLPTIRRNKTGTGWTAGTIALYFVNLIHSKVWCNRIEGFEEGIKGESKIGLGCAWNHLYVDFLDNNKVQYHLTQDGTADGFINANTLHGTAFAHLTAEGTNVSGVKHVMIDGGFTNVCNDDDFDDCAFEDKTAEFMIHSFGTTSNFIKCRFDGIGGDIRIKLDATAAVGNGVEGSHNNFAYGTYFPLVPVFTQDAQCRGNIIHNRNRLTFDGSGAIECRNASSDSANAFTIGDVTTRILDADLATEYRWGFTAENIRGKRKADADNRIEINGNNGQVVIGDGTNPPDTNLYRGAANQLKTDDAFFCDTLLTKAATEVVTTTNVITAAESGTTFYLNAVGGFTSTLPAPAVGLKFKFIVSTAPTTAYIITTNAGANLLFGTFLDIVGELVYFSAQDTLNFVASTSLVADELFVESDGTNWYCTAKSGADGGITVAVT